jgi:hypothetical protein
MFAIRTDTPLHLVATADGSGDVTNVTWGGLCVNGVNAKGSICEVGMPAVDAEISASISASFR